MAPQVLRAEPRLGELMQRLEPGDEILIESHHVLNDLAVPDPVSRLALISCNQRVTRGVTIGYLKPEPLIRRLFHQVFTNALPDSAAISAVRSANGWQPAPALCPRVPGPPVVAARPRTLREGSYGGRHACLWRGT